MYFGNSPTQQAYEPAIDYFNGDGTTLSFSLRRQVASVNQIICFIENVYQNPAFSFSVNNNVITFTSAPPAGNSNIVVTYTSLITQIVKTGQNTVGKNELENRYTLCSAWVSYDPATATIINSFNVLSVTSGTSGTGSFNINFKYPMPGNTTFVKDYVMLGMPSFEGGAPATIAIPTTTNQLTSDFREVRYFNQSGVAVNPTTVQLAFFS